MDGNGRRTQITHTKVVPADHFHQELVKECWIVPSSVVVRKTCYRAIGGFDQTLRACEDYDQWLRMSERYPFVGVDDTLVWYRRTGNNMTDDVERMFTSLSRVAEKHAGAAVGLPETWSFARRRMYSNAHRFALDCYIARGDLERAAHHLTQALTINPPLAGDTVLWYRLGCAHQPWELRGDWSTLDLRRAEKDVVGVLHTVWGHAGLSSPILSLRATAFGYGYFTLGLLAYGCRNLSAARSHLLKAARAYPRVTLERQWAPTFIKSCLGNRLLRCLTSRRRRGSRRTISE
jgi:hypothetical protein